MFNVKIDLAGLDDALKPLKPGGEVQMWLDNEFIKHCEPYVPWATGTLAHSPWLASDIGSGQIVYDTPYAEKVYRNPELNFNEAPMRGADWATRMWADRGAELVAGATKMAGGIKG